MRVLCVTNMWPTTAEPWYGSFVAQQVSDLRALGLEIDVLSFDARADRRRYVGAARAVRRAVRTGRYELVHAHYGLVGLSCVLARVPAATPVVTTFWGSDTGWVRWQRWVSMAVARLTYPVFVSARNAASVGLPHAEVIPMGIDTDLFRPRDRREAKSASGVPIDVPAVLLPGAWSNPRKRPGLFRSTLAVLQRDGLQVHGFALEGLPRERVPIALSAADVVLMTSAWEGSPATVLEALACRTPVVSTIVGDVSERLDGLPGCAAVQDDPHALAEAVRFALAVGTSDSLRERALEYDGRVIARRVAAMYSRILDAPAV